MPTKFAFVSPGIEMREIDESVLETVPEKDGILLIGRARSGPVLKPIKVNSLNDFTDIFGLPMDGVRQADPWRNGNTGAPNYAAYAAQAYLAAGLGPVKYVRLAGRNKSTLATEVAGWNLGETPTALAETNRCAQGLFIFPSASAISNGILAAVFYVTQSTVALYGDAAAYGTGSGVYAGAMVNSTGSWEFNVVISSSMGVDNMTASIGWDPNASNFIRNQFNTDATLVEGTTNYAGDITSNKTYFLGETFETAVHDLAASSAASDKAWGCIVSLKGTDGSFDDFNLEATGSRSGWFIGTKPTQKKLFYLESLSAGVDFQNNCYTVIKDIKLATSMQPNGSFTLQVLKRNGLRPIVIEEFVNLTLNIDDENYIVKRIGDFNEVWSPAEKKYVLSGRYPNKSNYVRVQVAQGLGGNDVPFGFLGPKRPSPVSVTNNTGDTLGGFITSRDDILHGDALRTIGQMTAGQTASFGWPALSLTTTASASPIGANYKNTDIYGLRERIKGKASPNKSTQDLLVRRAILDPHLRESDSNSNASIVFNLDDIRSGSAGGTPRYFWESGSYSLGAGSGQSISGLIGRSGSNGLITGLRIKQFAAPFFGGSEGVDIRRADPFSNARLDEGADTYPHYTLRTVLDMVEDKELLSYELMAMPGVLNNDLNERFINIASERGTSLAVVDFPGIYRPNTDTDNIATQPKIQTIVDHIDTRQIDNSYAATYYPNVRVQDTLNGNNSILIAPPSVAAIGAMAKSEADSQPWFAPAGFNRGGLSRLGGSNGPIVVGTIQHLTKADRDVLYATHINPIARFPATGDTVIFGQRTLQMEASALDRINVRRLLIYLKRQIGYVADTILFDQNVLATWNRFKSRADEILSSVKTELGITEYKLVLDQTTTTPDLIDRNIMYAKIFVKPARAIEFIAIDFIITQTGVEFE